MNLQPRHDAPRNTEPTSSGFPGELKQAILKTLTVGGFTLLFAGFLFQASGTGNVEATSLAGSSGSTAQYNSQTLPLLRPAFNSNPKAARGGGDISVVDGAALRAQAGSSGTIADIEDRPASSQISVYTVHDRDTLSGIAKMFGVSVNTVVWANDIKGGAIYAGDQLVILPVTGIKHAVLKGETLASLAKTYKSDAGDIAQYNGLADNAKLVVDDVVIIPNGEIPAAKAPSSNSKKVGTEPFLGGGGPAIDGYFIWPVAGGIITQKLHGWNGVDIGAPRGTAIYAAADGTVIIAKSNGTWNSGYGNYVVIVHSNGTQTLYGHASKVLVSAGDRVSQGQTIALVGSTGLSTGPHLHFEVRGAANPFASLGVGGSE